MSQEDREQYRLLKLVTDFRAQAAEREKQRVRVRRAHHELWQLELREKQPVEVCVLNPKSRSEWKHMRKARSH